MAAVVAVAATLFAADSSAGAAALGLETGCSAVGAIAQGPTPVYLALSNPSEAPCVNDARSVLTASATVIPGVLGVGATKVTIGGVTSKTHQGYDFFGDYYVTASADIANLTISGPGLLVKATGVHSDSTVVYGDGGFFASANSWIASLTVNGARVTVAKNVAITVPVGLRTAIYVNQRSVIDGSAFAATIRVTFPDFRYGLIVAGSEAFLQFPPG